MSTIEDRLRHLIGVVTENRQRDKKLFEKTGIGADTWKNFWFNRRAVDAKMVEAVCKAWPEYAFWLVTGVTDSTHGHIGPETAYTCWINRKAEEQALAAAYFQKKIKLMKKLSAEGREQPNDMELDEIIHALNLRDSVHDRIKQYTRDLELKLLTGESDQDPQNEEKFLKDLRRATESLNRNGDKKD